MSSQPQDILLAAVSGPPRTILLLLRWNVGDALAEQCIASIIISTSLVLVTICVYASVALCCCSRRSPFIRRQDRKARTTDLWTVHNRRYDLSDYVHLHPGGIDAISLGQGHNCTELFEMYHSLANEKLVRARLERYYVEDVPEGAIDYENRFDWKHTPFYSALKMRVRAHFKQHGDVRFGHKADGLQWAQLISFIVASGFALYGFMCGNSVAMILLPFCYWWGPSSCMHDGGHFALSSRPWVNRICSHIGGAHMSMFGWFHQHVIGHHVDTNIANFDPDLYHFTIGSVVMPGFRTSLELQPLPECSFWPPRFPRALWWRLGLAFRVPLSTFGPTILWDIMSLFNTQAFLGLVPYRKLWMQGLFTHSVGRSIVIWLAIIHPITVSLVTATGWMAGIMRASLFVVAPYAIHGCIFYVFSQVSHVQHECSELCSDGDQEDGSPSSGSQFEAPQPREWAVQQVEHTLDYAVDSRIWLHISNGLNLQTVHHLFPQVGWGHYTALSPIIREVCDEFNIKYSTKPSFLQAVLSHYAYLADINSGPSASAWYRPPSGRACHSTMEMLGQVGPPMEKAQ